MLLNVADSHSGPFVVQVLLEAKPGSEIELKEALTEVVEPHRSQKACLDYHIHQDIYNPTKFGIYARWVSEEEHDKEFNKPYVQALLKKLEQILIKPMEVLAGVEV